MKNENVYSVGPGSRATSIAPSDGAYQADEEDFSDARTPTQSDYWQDIDWEKGFDTTPETMSFTLQKYHPHLVQHATLLALMPDLIGSETYEGMRAGVREEFPEQTFSIRPSTEGAGYALRSNGHIITTISDLREVGWEMTDHEGTYEIHPGRFANGKWEDKSLATCLLTKIRDQGVDLGVQLDNFKITKLEKVEDQAPVDEDNRLSFRYDLHPLTISGIDGRATWEGMPEDPLGGARVQFNCQLEVQCYLDVPKS